MSHDFADDFDALLRETDSRTRKTHGPSGEEQRADERRKREIEEQERRNAERRRIEAEQSRREAERQRRRGIVHAERDALLLAIEKLPQLGIKSVENREEQVTIVVTSQPGHHSASWTQQEWQAAEEYADAVGNLSSGLRHCHLRIEGDHVIHVGSLKVGEMLAGGSVTVSQCPIGARIGHGMSAGMLRICQFDEPRFRSNAVTTEIGAELSNGEIIIDDKSMRAASVGAGMSGGTITIGGDVYAEAVGDEMSGGCIRIMGDLSAKRLGTGMKGGSVVVSGNVTGDTYIGRNMSHGQIMIDGNAWAWNLGSQMSGGSITISGDSNPQDIGYEMQGGDISVVGNIGGLGMGYPLRTSHIGAWMTGGVISLERYYDLPSMFSMSMQCYRLVRRYNDLSKIRRARGE